MIDVGSASLTQELVLRSSAATTLHIAALALSGPFELRTGNCAAPPLALPPGRECWLALAFVPSAAGPATGTLAITSEAAGSPVAVALSGTGSAPPEPVPDLVGGCSIGAGQGGFDPLWWLLVALAAALLLRRPRGGG